MSYSQDDTNEFTLETMMAVAEELLQRDARDAMEILQRLAEEQGNNEDEEEQEIVRVKNFTYNGKKYLIDEENTLYDIDTHDDVGIWDVEAKSIYFNMD